MFKIVETIDQMAKRANRTNNPFWLSCDTYISLIDVQNKSQLETGYLRGRAYNLC